MIYLMLMFVNELCNVAVSTTADYQTGFWLITQESDSLDEVIKNGQGRPGNETGN